MKNYIIKLKDNISKLAPGERKIAEYLLNNLDDLNGLSSKNMSMIVGVAQSSISKFCKKMGAKGFSELKLSLLLEHNKNQAEIKRNPHLHGSTNSNDTLPIIAEKLLHSNIESMRNTIDNLDFEKLEEVINLIDKSHKIQIIGIGGSALVAQDLTNKLLKIGYSAIFNLDTHAQISVTQTLHSDDLLIALSYSGETNEIVLAANVAKKCKAKIIAITSYCDSRLKKIADINLITVSDESKWRSSSLSTRIAQASIIDIIFVGLIRLNDKASIRHIKRSNTLIKKLR
ncbi:SIS domain-containing protein [Enterobacter cancerogenus]|nr:SIS domain-containing protein [Enterobacter cancerogenus]EKS7427135.1 SIS domain-containing protein [Enterobacter cancerogenus]QGG09216.1 SIS domain-containing protein [Enterobacter cancerogenus]CAD5353384.1 putative DNA-binding transcriptional regulator [Enterobacter cancerogenus]HBI6867553.1 SIS domain-containing protein [Enterobacter cancerogenus]